MAWANKLLAFDKTYWVAFSGGMDSHVLLELMAELRQHSPIHLRAIYINHGLSPHAAKWGAHCRQVCADYHIELIERSVCVDISDGRSLEEVAREQRYAVFAEYIQAGDVLLTAHHQDDQAETMLLQLMRGAGPKGLAAMPMVKPFGRGFHLRPLLTVSHEELIQYAKEKQLRWIEDESNAETTLARNFIRHEVMPSLKSRWPTVAATISRSASHCGEAQALLEEYAVEDWKKVTGSQEKTLSVQKLLTLSSPRINQVLRLWVSQQGYSLPDTKKMAAIQTDVLRAAWDRSPCVMWEGAEVRRYRDDLYLLAPLAPIDENWEEVWDLVTPIEVPGVGVLQAMEIDGVEGPVTVRFRRGGETLCLPKRGRHTLKNLFQEWNVLPWLRDRVPLVFKGGELVGVVLERTS